jgi:hypothetical protein
MQPNCVKMEEALDLCGKGTDTERWVGCMCVYGYARAEMEVFWMCLEEGSLQNLCEQEREEKLCVCVWGGGGVACVCVREPTLKKRRRMFIREVLNPCTSRRCFYWLQIYVINEGTENLCRGNNILTRNNVSRFWIRLNRRSASWKKYCLMLYSLWDERCFIFVGEEPRFKSSSEGRDAYIN